MRRSSIALTVAALLSGAGCDDGVTGPGPLPTESRVAYVEPGQKPALFIQNADGSGRFRVHFNGAEDFIAGNVPAELLPVVDEQIKAIGPVEWSPDGRSLAVELSLAYDQSQVVLLDADGSNARTVSPNTQIILSDVAWSPDGRRLAYTMSTLPRAAGIDVFITDLATSKVMRVTHGEDLGIEGVELAWSRDGQVLYWTKQHGELDADGLSNALTAIYSHDLTTGMQRIVATGLLGRATGLAHDAEWVLLVRNTARDAQGYLRALYRHPLATGAEQLLLQQSAPVMFAELTPHQCSAVVALDTRTEPQSARWEYLLLPMRSGPATHLLEGAGEAGAVDAYFAREDC